MFKLLIAAALGGAVGAGGRFLVAHHALRLMGPSFPWGTLTVNIVGSFVMGILVELMALKITVTPELRTFLITGVLGGFTTFSAFSLDVAVLVERNAIAPALTYVLVSVLCSVGGLFFALWIVRSYLAG